MTPQPRPHSGVGVQSPTAPGVAPRSRGGTTTGRGSSNPCCCGRGSSMPDSCSGSERSREVGGMKAETAEGQWDRRAC